MDKTKTTGILLINLGTPNSPKTKDIRKYLREFLNDPRVIDIPRLNRFILLNLFILPFRPHKIQPAYSKIWSSKGSPLLFFSKELVSKLQERFSGDVVLELGMRYGNPSIKSALSKLLSSPIKRLLIFPLFPQYSSAATGSAIECALNILKNSWNIPKTIVYEHFYNNTHFIDSCVKIHKQTLKNFDYDYLLFSYHGLPERHIKKSEPLKVDCDLKNSCPPIGVNNYYCYRAQCFATTKFIADKLDLKKNYGTSFQSRLGRTPWIKPYTDKLLPQLREQGIKRLAISSPSFVADCLETLEEIGIRLKDQWFKLGGEDFALIPSLNAEDVWVESLFNILTDELKETPLKIIEPNI